LLIASRRSIDQPGWTKKCGYFLDDNSPVPWEQALARKFDDLVVYSIDILGRSLKHCLNILESLKAHRTDFISIRQQIDTSSPTGQLIFNIFACLASYERTQVLERTALGRERAKAHGVKFGRPTKMNSSVAEAVRLLREKGAGIKEIAMSLQIGVGSVYQTLRTAKTAA
jgi:DNA invertase Pin-like site-specific DNA recombinase